MWQLRNEFPLHKIVFQQTASHLPHEGNCENVFSRAGHLSDPNTNPEYLAVLTSVGINKATFKPTVPAIKTKYFSKFSKNGDEGGDEGGDEDLQRQSS